jgi:hypothetical protein
MQFWTEVFIPLQEVLYDPQLLGDKLPVELVWELNTIVKQIYLDDVSASENTAKQVRVIVDFGTRDRWAQIWAVEIINPETSQVSQMRFGSIDLKFQAPFLPPVVSRSNVAFGQILSVIDEFLEGLGKF